MNRAFDRGPVHMCWHRDLQSLNLHAVPHLFSDILQLGAGFVVQEFIPPEAIPRDRLPCELAHEELLTLRHASESEIQADQQGMR